jgi:hypothetical protein
VSIIRSPFVGQHSGRFFIVTVFDGKTREEGLPTSSNPKFVRKRRTGLEAHTHRQTMKKKHWVYSKKVSEKSRKGSRKDRKDKSINRLRSFFPLFA